MAESPRQDPSNRRQDATHEAPFKLPASKEDVMKPMSNKKAIRMHAELSSFIAVTRRQIEEDKQREVEDKVEDHIKEADAVEHGQASQPFNGYSTSYHSSPIRTHTPHRGGYGHGYGRGRNHYAPSYHPYARPAYPAPRFKNNSVSFQHQTQNHTTEHKTLCQTFTKTGSCSRHGCPYYHDPDKVAVCKGWLFKDGCTLGSKCPLAHYKSSHNAPTCSHFQEGRCSNEDCRFAHIGLSPDALHCVAFAQQGYCQKGDRCPEVHSYECPFFANGNCRFGDKCRMPHKYDASRMRQKTRRPSDSRSIAGSYTDMDSPKEVVEESPELKKFLGETAQERENHHFFSQQADFVSLKYD